MSKVVLCVKTEVVTTFQGSRPAHDVINSFMGTPSCLFVTHICGCLHIKVGSSGCGKVVTACEVGNTYYPAFTGKVADQCSKRQSLGIIIAL